MLLVYLHKYSCTAIFCVAQSGKHFMYKSECRIKLFMYPMHNTSIIMTVLFAVCIHIYVVVAEIPVANTGVFIQSFMLNSVWFCFLVKTEFKCKLGVLYAGS